MKKEGDYIAGSHHYWIHFWCGLVFGVGIGICIGCQMFDSGWPIIVTAIVVSLITAYTCGRCGDRAWHWLLQHLTDFT